MRNKNRIDGVCQVIQDIWINLRKYKPEDNINFYRAISYIYKELTKEKNDIFYLEDDIIKTKLLEVLEFLNKKVDKKNSLLDSEMKSIECTIKYFIDFWKLNSDLRFSQIVSLFSDKTQEYVCNLSFEEWQSILIKYNLIFIDQLIEYKTTSLKELKTNEDFRKIHPNLTDIEFKKLIENISNSENKQIEELKNKRLEYQNINQSNELTDSKNILKFLDKEKENIKNQLDVLYVTLDEVKKYGAKTTFFCGDDDKTVMDAINYGRKIGTLERKFRYNK